MNFIIYDSNNNSPICKIPSNNGKNALKKFRNCLMSSGFYEIHKRCNIWILSSSYGAYFVAIPEKK